MQFPFAKIQPEFEEFYINGKDAGPFGKFVDSLYGKPPLEAEEETEETVFSLPPYLRDIEWTGIMLSSCLSKHSNHIFFYYLGNKDYTQLQHDIFNLLPNSMLPNGSLFKYLDSKTPGVTEISFI